ncbi:hypothetical protein PV04_01353 [Phialophora macrospora]|uniref:Transcription factor domain-containing protein n=1 Tax=Phialophora macrospora TaxID=1851006 RepID=A0A0D2GLF2_9EURO|nr:hypothetical protein PV04_01353 [Phialophora macrospora]
MPATGTQRSSRPKFKFLLVSNEPKTAKERELEVTEIRTHAARISYRKKETHVSRGPLSLGAATESPSITTSSSRSSGDSSDSDPDDNSSWVLEKAIGGVRVDPFNSDSVPGLPAWILDLVDNAWTNAWCTLRTHRHDGLIHPDVYGWRRAGLTCPALVHAHISGAIGIALAQGTWTDVKARLHRTQIYHANLAIKCVRTELVRSNGLPPDELLLSIMTMSGHGEVVDDDDDRKPSNAFAQSPLARANRVDIFAKLRITDAHAQAITTLVGQKGGLDNITLPGFRSLLSLTDILQASIKGTQPRLPFVGGTESLVSSGKHVLDHRALESNTTLGTGFEQAGIAGIGPEMYTAVLAACELTAALDHFQRNENHPPLFVDIVEYRKYVQYRLLSLTPVNSDGPLCNNDDYMYETCRIALLIYSDLNIWPLPPSTHARPRLARQLRDALGQYGTGAPETALPADLLLWLAMMGAIAAHETRHEPYFVDLLARDPRDLSWDIFHSIVRKYLWCDFVVTPPARHLWFQACMMRPVLNIINSGQQ